MGHWGSLMFLTLLIGIVIHLIKNSMEDQLEVVVTTTPRTILGEGPFWDVKEQVLYWIDIKGKKIHRYNPDTKANDFMDVGKQIGCVVPRKSGGLMAALQDGFYHIDFNAKQMKKITDPEEDKPLNRFNDGKCDPRGRFWAGTMEDQETGPALGALYRMDTDLSVHKVFGNLSSNDDSSLEPVAISNGLTWSLDNKTMYYIDSPAKAVFAFDYNVDTGNITNKRTVVHNIEGWPDGMTIDKEGMIWVAHWGASRLTRWNPNTGELLRTVFFPVSRITSCCFGGKNLDVLYITTASKDADLEKEPLAGSLFVLKNPGVQGTELTHFEG